MQGDVIAIVDKDAKTVAKYSYDAWGAVTSAVTDTELTKNVDIATITPFRYRGYYYDEEIELYYLQSRYYDASVGRFINSDAADITQGAHFYMVENTSSGLTAYNYSSTNSVYTKNTFAELINTGSFILAYRVYEQPKP